MATRKTRSRTKAAATPKDEIKSERKGAAKSATTSASKSATKSAASKPALELAPKLASKPASKSARRSAPTSRSHAARGRSSSSSKARRNQAALIAPAATEFAFALPPVSAPAPLPAFDFVLPPVREAGAVTTPKLPAVAARRRGPSLGQRAREDLDYVQRRLSRRATQEFAALKRAARQARRSLDRTLQVKLAQAVRLRRSLRHRAQVALIRAQGEAFVVSRRLRRTGERLLRETSNAAAGRAAITQRWLKRDLARRIRYARDWMSRSAETTLIEAQDTVRRNFRPMIAHVAPSHRTALAGGAAAVAVVLISMGWLALFDHATAVPSRDAVAAAQVHGDWSNLSVENPMLANIELPVPQAAEQNAPAEPFVSTPAARASKPAASLPPKTVTPLPTPAPAKKAAAPVRRERATARASKHHSNRSRRYSTSTNKHRSEAEAGGAAGEAFASAYTGDGNSLIGEARRYLGTNPIGRSSLWCGAFMDMVLRKTGHKGGGNLALGYEHYGVRVAGPEIGAIAVMGRRGGGHVGVVSGIDPNGNPIVISGNHNHTVAEAVYPRRRIITYVVPN